MLFCQQINTNAANATLVSMTVTNQMKPRGNNPQKTALTRQQIVEAALALFLAHGFAKTTMAAIAKKSGLAKGTAYHYFQNKEDLFAGIVDTVMVDSLFCTDKHVLQPGEGIEDFFRRTLLPFMQTIEATPRAAIIRLVLTEGNDFPQIKEIYSRLVYGPLMANISKVAEEATKRGEHRAAALIDYPQLLIGPAWVGITTNQILNVAPHIDIGAMFDAQLRLLFR